MVSIAEVHRLQVDTNKNCMAIMYLCSIVHLYYGAKGKQHFPPVQLTTSRIGYHSRVTHTLLKVLTIDKYIILWALWCYHSLENPIESKEEFLSLLQPMLPLSDCFDPPFLDWVKSQNHRGLDTFKYFFKLKVFDKTPSPQEGLIVLRRCYEEHIVSCRGDT